MAGRGPNIALGWILFFFLMTVAKLTQFYTAERYLCSFLEYAKKHGVDAFAPFSPEEKRWAHSVMARAETVHQQDDIDNLFPIPREQLLLIRHNRPSRALSARSASAQMLPWGVVVVPRIADEVVGAFLLLHELAHASWIGWSLQRWSQGYLLSALVVAGMVFVADGSPKVMAALSAFAIGYGCLCLLINAAAAWIEEVLCDACAILGMSASHQTRLMRRLKSLRFDRYWQQLLLQSAHRYGAVDLHPDEVISSSRDANRLMYRVMGGFFHTLVLRALVWWLRPLNDSGTPMWPTVLWNIAKLAGPLTPGAFLVVGVFIIPAHYPLWLYVALGLLTAYLTWGARLEQRVGQVRETERFAPLLCLDPHIKELLTKNGYCDVPEGPLSPLA